MNNMGTVEKIVEVLNKMGSDKKAQATSRYEEHSHWLSNEFSSIRNLIQPGAPVPAAETTAVSNSAASRQKRKSPETCSAGNRNSPLHKRNSGTEFDLTELLAAQGLPADLNKLKKDQLLEHLNAQGEHNLTMKNLKKEMVEGLKELIIQAHRKSIPDIPTELSNQENVKPDVQEVSTSVQEVSTSVQEVSTSVEDVEVKLDKEEVKPVVQAKDEPPPQQQVVDQDPVQTEPIKQVVTSLDEQKSDVVELKPEELKAETLPPPPVVSTESPRKQSILSEYRQQMSAATVTAPVPATAVRSSILRGQTEESAEDRNARVQSEFEARKMRHRMSQVGRKSDASASSSVASGGTGAGVEKEVPPKIAEVSSEKATPLEEELPLQSLMQTTEPANLTVEMETEDDDQSNWNEVPSPKRENSEDDSMPVIQTAKVEEVVHVEKVKVEPAAVPVNEKPVHTQPKVEAPSARPLSTKTTTSDNAVKKPSNLVGGNQLSFLSSAKPVSSAPAAGVKTNKSAVPALAMAARQKEKEEARALQKKKELEDKKREHLRKMQQQQQKSGSSRTLGTSSSKATASAPSSTTNAAASSKSVLEKSFGWALGKKKEEHVSDTKENKVAAPPAKPVVTSSSSSTAKSSSSSAAPVLSEKKINPAEYKQVTPSKPAAPQQVPAHDLKISPTVEVSPPREEYKIEDDEDSDSDSGSGTDDEEDDKKKQIPDWAKGPKLREALEKQYGLNGHVAVDPDRIFPDVQTCSLEEIFGKREGKCGKYSVRTSSAKWDEDEITLVEKRKYRNVMGYI